MQVIKSTEVKQTDSIEHPLKPPHESTEIFPVTKNLVQCVRLLISRCHQPLPGTHAAPELTVRGPDYGSLWVTRANMPSFWKNTPLRWPNRWCACKHHGYKGPKIGV